MLPTLAIMLPPIDPVAISIGSLAIRWYALAYVVGILFVLYYAKWLSKRSELWLGKPSFSGKDLDDSTLIGALGVVFGGRIGYILVYNPSYYLSNPSEILAVWHGGMSFHGGLIGVVIGVAFFCRSRNIPGLAFGDVLAAGTPVALFLGRIANFINSELYGRPTDLPWGVVFPAVSPIPLHPSQIYEALLEGLLLLVILSYLIFKRQALRQRGLVTGVFLFGYGVSRIFVENFRLPDPQLGYLVAINSGGITMGMILSLPLVIAGATLIFYSTKSSKSANLN